MFDRVVDLEPWLEKVLPRGGGVAVDIGANAGDWTAGLAEVFREVHAFEPNPALAPALLGVKGNVLVHGVALGARTGTETLNIYEDDRQSTLLPERPERTDYTRSIEVEVRPLDSYRLLPDFVKCDVEGYEDMVFAGARRTLKEALPDIVVEIHNYPCLEAVSGLLEGLDYDLEHIAHPHPDASPEHSWISARHARRIR